VLDEPEEPLDSRDAAAYRACFIALGSWQQDRRLRERLTEKGALSPKAAGELTGSLRNRPRSISPRRIISFRLAPPVHRARSKRFGNGI